MKFVIRILFTALALLSSSIAHSQSETETRLETELRGLISGQGLLVVNEAYPLSEIFVDDVLKGISDSNGDAYIYLPSGLHRIRIETTPTSGSDHLTFSTNVFLQEGQAFILRADFAKQSENIRSFDAIYKEFLASKEAASDLSRVMQAADSLDRVMKQSTDGYPTALVRDLCGETFKTHTNSAQRFWRSRPGTLASSMDNPFALLVRYEEFRGGILSKASFDRRALELGVKQVKLLLEAYDLSPTQTVRHRFPYVTPWGVGETWLEANFSHSERVKLREINRLSVDIGSWHPDQFIVTQIPSTQWLSGTLRALSQNGSEWTNSFANKPDTFEKCAALLGKHLDFRDEFLDWP